MLQVVLQLKMLKKSQVIGARIGEAFQYSIPAPRDKIDICTPWIRFLQSNQAFPLARP